MSAKKKAVDTAVFFQEECGSEYERRQRLAKQALAELGATPETVWGFLLYHRYEWRWTIPRAEAAVKPDKLRQMIKAGFELKDAVEDEVLRRALLRLVCLAAATVNLETRPTAKTLQQTSDWLDRFKALANEPQAAYEEALLNGQQLYDEARGRARAWAALAKPRDPDADFAFIADYIFPSDLEWAIDPLVILPEFQAWAKEEIVKRRVTKKTDELRGFRPDMCLRWSVTRPAAEMPALSLGRLLAAQLAGIDAPKIASMLCGERGAAPLFKQLLDSELEANAVVKGESLLQHAASQGDAEIVALLLAAGAKPGRKKKALLAEAKGSKVKKLLRDALEGAAPAPKGKKQLPKRLTSLDQWPDLTEVAYAELAAAERIAKLSGDEWHTDDLFGDDPQAVYRAKQSVRWPTGLFFCPDDYGYLVIDGDLIVQGVLQLEAVDLANVLVVKGNLEARGLVISCESQLYVRGTTTLQAGAVFDLGDAGAAQFGGKVSSPALVDVGRTPPRFRKNKSLRCASREQLQASLVEEGSYPKMKAIVARLAANKPILAQK